jgi:hypothetical protein
MELQSIVLRYGAEGLHLGDKQQASRLLAHVLAQVCGEPLESR